MGVVILNSRNHTYLFEHLYNDNNEENMISIYSNNNLFDLKFIQPPLPYLFFPSNIAYSMSKRRAREDSNDESELKRVRDFTRMYISLYRKISDNQMMLNINLHLHVRLIDP